MSVLANLNGKIGHPSELAVSVLDRGFLFGDGVYETGRSYDRTVIFLEEHWRRLRRSAEKLAIPVPWTDAHLTQGLHATLKAFAQDNAYFRTIVTRGVIDRVGLDIDPADIQPTLVHIVQMLPVNLDERRSRGIRLHTSKIRRNAAAAQDPNIKSSNYLNSLLALRDARENSFDDAILLNSEGEVTEGTTFSVFGLSRDGSLITSELSIGILDSITRRHVLSVAAPHLKLCEGRYKLAEFQACSEVFIASSVREIFPVSAWDGNTYAVPGPKTKQIHTWLRDDIARYVATHAKF